MKKLLLLISLFCTLLLVSCSEPNEEYKKYSFPNEYLEFSSLNELNTYYSENDLLLYDYLYLDIDSATDNVYRLYYDKLSDSEIINPKMYYSCKYTDELLNTTIDMEMISIQCEYTEEDLRFKIFELDDSEYNYACEIYKQGFNGTKKIVYSYIYFKSENELDENYFFDLFYNNKFRLSKELTISETIENEIIQAYLEYINFETAEIRYYLGNINNIYFSIIKGDSLAIPSYDIYKIGDIEIDDTYMERLSVCYNNTYYSFVQAIRENIITEEQALDVYNYYQRYILVMKDGGVI